MAEPHRRVIDTALLLAISGALFYASAKIYQNAYYGYFGLPSDLQPSISTRDAALLALQAAVLPLAAWGLQSISDWGKQAQASAKRRVRWLATELGLFLFGAIAVLYPAIYDAWSWRFLFDGILVGGVVVLLGSLFADEPWMDRATSSPYALVAVWALFVLLSASPAGRAKAQGQTDFYTLPSQPSVALVATSTDVLSGVYVVPKNKLTRKLFVLRLEVGKPVQLVKKDLGQLHH
jgi:hypothetical protein